MTATLQREVEGLRWLSAEFVVSREEAQRHLGPMLAEGLVSKGYANEAKDGRIAVAEAGRRLLAAQDPAGGEE